MTPLVSKHEPDPAPSEQCSAAEARHSVTDAPANRPPIGDGQRSSAENGHRSSADTSQPFPAENGRHSSAGISQRSPAENGRHSSADTSQRSPAENGRHSLNKDGRAALHAISVPPEPQRGPAPRPIAAGKFITRGCEKLYLRGVTYGTFSRDEDGSQYSPAAVEDDFAAMAAAGINAVRTYTVPPRWLLDRASEQGLTVLVGLPWEQHVAFADDRARCRSITWRVREGVSACAGHPAVLGYAVGNEIPAPIVRWHGRRRVERFIRTLYQAAKDEDPEGLVTYVNFPSTEYLELPFLDFVSFNVYVEQRERLDAYLYRLHNLAGDRPLVLAELGLDSRRNGKDGQARSLSWQIRSAFGGGCAGLFTFAWTDEWWRGGEQIEDWDFGLTTRARLPKPALSAVSDAYSEVPPTSAQTCPQFSVVVCTYNGAATLQDCLDGLTNLDYPDYEVIVVDDGSTDHSAEIVSLYDVRLVRTPNQGLASARNVGMDLASGEIIAYIDDDARPDPHWLRYLAHEFARTHHCAVGGPNIAPAGDGLAAQCVANAPGGPVHVLLSDSEAEHVPGCNMAIRTDALRAIGGFDPQFVAAGDDVDLCWRLQQQGWTIGFAPAAFVWHHCRNSLRAYWRQQRGYGKAEALLERKWPERYNSLGHLSWSGRMYGRGLQLPVVRKRQRIYHGTWGLGLFQSIYEPAHGTLATMPLMPEWYLLIFALAALSGAGTLWPPLLAALPLLALCLLVAVAGAARSAARHLSPAAGVPARRRAVALALTTTLHIIQPAARLYGRLAHGLSPWRRRRGGSLRLPIPRTLTAWSETWLGPEQRLKSIETGLRGNGAAVVRGGNFDRWDLEVSYGTVGRVRARVAVEEHGRGRQLIRLRYWPHWSLPGVAAVVLLALFGLASTLGDALWVGGLSFGLALVIALRAGLECGRATGGLARAFIDTSESASPVARSVRERSSQ